MGGQEGGRGRGNGFRLRTRDVGRKKKVKRYRYRKVWKRENKGEYWESVKNNGVLEKGNHPRERERVLVAKAG